MPNCRAGLRLGPQCPEWRFVKPSQTSGGLKAPNPHPPAATPSSCSPSAATPPPGGTPRLRSSGTSGSLLPHASVRFCQVPSILGSCLAGNFRDAAAMWFTVRGPVTAPCMQGGENMETTYLVSAFVAALLMALATIFVQRSQLIELRELLYKSPEEPEMPGPDNGNAPCAHAKANAR